jgi:ubiquinone/menaquinone biosynthesis C-methylase UbiE
MKRRDAQSLENAEATCYFLKYLTVAPFALALWRAQEAAIIFEGYKEFEEEYNKIGSPFRTPLLDVGCGFGEFAGVFFESQVEVGIDISLDDLVLAKRTKKYKKLQAADARRLPFEDNSFRTVLSMSVLEHIPKVQQSMAEIYRVLKPGGLFIYTVPTTVLNESLFYPRFFSSLGLRGLSEWYLRSYHKVFKHENIVAPEVWIQMTQSAGFQVLETQGTFSRRLVEIFDLALPTALPSQISRWLFGSRWVWGLPLKRKIVLPIFNSIIRDKNYNNSNMLVIATKPDKIVG